MASFQNNGKSMYSTEVKKSIKRNSSWSQTTLGSNPNSTIYGVNLASLCFHVNIGKMGIVTQRVLVRINDYP